MTEWYSMSEENRIKNVYSKYTIQQFFEWWSNNEKRIMEVRIRNNTEVIKQIHKKYGYPMSLSGIYITNYFQLKRVISYVRDKGTVWFGVNPRKFNYIFGTSKGLGGADPFIDSITHIIIDIDRVDKVGFATVDDLRNADELANNILGALATQKWDRNFCKIASGNGVQLLISLDVPIRMPKINYDVKERVYLMNEKFDRIKQIITRGIGKQMLTYSRRFKKTLYVEVDKTGFNIGRVGALPVTKNFKYDSFRWRGIINMKTGINIGLTDYILSYENDIKKYMSIKIFSCSISHDSAEIINKGQLKKNKLSQFLLNNDFPQGGINNRIWYQLKILLRDSNFDLNTNEFRTFHAQLKRLHNRTFSTNIPDKNHTFNPAAVNNYCIEFMFPLVYPWRDITHRNRKNGYNISTNWEAIKNWSNKPMILDEGTAIFDDLTKCKEQFKGQVNVNKIISSFIQGCIIKYGEKYSKYIFNEVLHDFLEYS